MDPICRERGGIQTRAPMRTRPATISHAASCAPNLATIHTGKWRALHCRRVRYTLINLFARAYARSMNS